MPTDKSIQNAEILRVVTGLLNSAAVAALVQKAVIANDWHPVDLGHISDNLVKPLFDYVENKLS